MKRLRPVPASQEILEKIEVKHGILFEEVEELLRRPHVVLRGPVDQYGERRYSSVGQTSSGRYLLVVYAGSEPGIAKVITARDMIGRERSFYKKASGKRRRL
jgi:uncharacterized DUF497 family protein